MKITFRICSRNLMRSSKICIIFEQCAFSEAPDQKCSEFESAYSCISKRKTTSIFIVCITYKFPQQNQTYVNDNNIEGETNL